MSKYKSAYLYHGDNFIATVRFETGTTVPFDLDYLNTMTRQLRREGYSLIAYDETSQYWRKSVDKN